MQGLMGDCGAPGSAVCWKVRGCVGVCDGVVTVPAVAWSRGVCRTQRTKDWQNSAASVFSLSKLKSLLHAKSVTNEQDRFSPLASSHSFQIHLQNVCFHASWNNIVTCLGLFFYLLRSGLLCRTSRIFTKELSKSGTVLCSGPCFACNFRLIYITTQHSKPPAWPSLHRWSRRML